MASDLNWQVGPSDGYYSDTVEPDEPLAPADYADLDPRPQSDRPRAVARYAPQTGPPGDTT